MNAIQALYQLSYGPTGGTGCFVCRPRGGSYRGRRRGAQAEKIRAAGAQQAGLGVAGVRVRGAGAGRVAKARPEAGARWSAYLTALIVVTQIITKRATPTRLRVVNMVAHGDGFEQPRA